MGRIIRLIRMAADIMAFVSSVVEFLDRLDGKEAADLVERGKKLLERL